MQLSDNDTPEGDRRWFELSLADAIVLASETAPDAYPDIFHRILGFETMPCAIVRKIRRSKHSVSEVIPLLRVYLHCGDHDLRCGSIGALRELRVRDAGVIADIRNCMRDEHPAVRTEALSAFLELSHEREEVLELLPEMLDDPMPDVRWYVVDRLGEIEPAARSALPRVMELIETDSNLHVRRSAIAAAEKILADIR